MVNIRNHSANHAAFTAEVARRIAQRAFWTAAKDARLDGPELIGAWMLEVSRRLSRDSATRLDYRQIIERWQAEDNQVFAGPHLNGLPPVENAADNAISCEVENA